jgi:hypothetical protein
VPPAPTPKTQVSPTHAFTASANGSRPGFWSRLFGDHKGHGSRDIRIEIRRGDLTITAQWPVEAAPECVQWLRTLDVPPVDVNRT